MSQKEKDQQIKDVVEYYDLTRYDYRTGWDDSDSPAVHFGYYDEHADKHKQALQNTNRTLAEFANVKAGDKVLDAGCGRGGSCFWLIKNLDVVPTGITPVQSQIDDCLSLAKKLKLESKTTFINADYCDTPFEDASFDVVWACESLCHALDKAAFYKEAYRLLRPGGRIVIAEYIRSERPLQQEGGEHLLHEWLRSWAIPDIDTQTEHESHAAAAGFKDFKIVNYNSKVRVSLRNLYEKSKLFKKISKLYTYITKRTKVQHQNLLGSIHQYDALNQGLWFYCIIVAEK